MRLIDTDEMLYELTHWKDNKGWYHDTRTDVYHISEIEMVCDRMPIIEAEPERKKGKWVSAKDGIDGHVKCNQCFKTYDYDSEAQYYNFCPNCAARMEEDNG